MSTLGVHPGAPQNKSGSSVAAASATAAKLSISGVIVAGGPLSDATIITVNAAAAKTPSQFRRYIAYDKDVKVGGSLAWRANNPGNLRDAPTKIGRSRARSDTLPSLPASMTDVPRRRTSI